MTKKQWEMVLSIEPYMRMLSKKFTPKPRQHNPECIQKTYDFLLDSAISAAKRYDPERNVKYITYFGSQIAFIVYKRWQREIQKEAPLSLDWVYNGETEDDMAGFLEDRKHRIDPSVEIDLKEAIKHLDLRYKEVISEYYGLDEQKSECTRDMAKKMGVSRQRVFQIFGLAKQKLKTKLNGYENETA